VRVHRRAVRWRRLPGGRRAAARGDQDHGLRSDAVSLPLRQDRPAVAPGPDEGVAASGGPLPPVALPLCCPGCGLVLDAGRLAAALYVCRCGHHLPMDGDAWVALLADAGTWRERWTELRTPDVPGWSRPRPYRQSVEEAVARGLDEAVRAGRCRLAGRPIWLAVF